MGVAHIHSIVKEEKTMRFSHQFGKFFDFVRVDGLSYYFDEYEKLPKAERLALRKEAVDRCTAANRAYSEAYKVLCKPLREEYETKLKAFRAKPRFQKRYRGRAQDMRYGEERLRREYQYECQKVQALRAPVDGCTYPAAVHDVFTVWETKVETTWEKYERMVTHFDWYYNYSDDHSVWSAGESRRKQIAALREQLTGEGMADEASALYNKCCPWLNEDGSQKEIY